MFQAACRLVVFGTSSWHPSLHGGVVLVMPFILNESASFHGWLFNAGWHALSRAKGVAHAIARATSPPKYETHTYPELLLVSSAPGYGGGCQRRSRLAFAGLSAAPSAKMVSGSLRLCRGAPPRGHLSVSKATPRVRAGCRNHWQAIGRPSRRKSGCFQPLAGINSPSDANTYSQKVLL
jgi:hypothetical protein